jgi:hypothetical protein
LSSLKKLKLGVQQKRINKIIGYCSILRGTPNILCDGDACVIAGSKQDIEKYIQTLSNRSTEDYIIKKTTFGEVYKGMKLGAEYAFDEKAYKVFLPLAKAMGMNLAEFKIEGDDTPPTPDAVRLMKVVWFPSIQEQ